MGKEFCAVRCPAALRRSSEGEPDIYAAAWQSWRGRAPAAFVIAAGSGRSYLAWGLYRWDNSDRSLAGPWRARRMGIPLASTYAVATMLPRERKPRGQRIAVRSAGRCCSAFCQGPGWRTEKVRVRGTAYSTHADKRSHLDDDGMKRLDCKNLIKMTQATMTSSGFGIRLIVIRFRNRASRCPNAPPPFGQRRCVPW